MRPLRSITRRRFIAGNCQIKELSPSMGLPVVPHLLQFSPPEQLRVSFLVLRKFSRDPEKSITRHPVCIFMCRYCR